MAISYARQSNLLFEEVTAHRLDLHELGCLAPVKQVETVSPTCRQADIRDIGVPSCSTWDEIKLASQGTLSDLDLSADNGLPSLPPEYLSNRCR